MRKNNYLLLIWIFLPMLLLFMACSAKQDTITIFVAEQHPQVEFALDELTNGLGKKGISVELTEEDQATIHISRDSTINELQPEGFQLVRNGLKVRLTGFDAAGMMYGCLELGEQIALYGLEGVENTTKNPYMEMRGPKFNIPLDVRTPSYSDASDAGQHNIPVMWDYEFWKEYIDHMARYRYNYISLWNLHPFPSLVEVPGYEDIALDDVQRSKGQWKELYSLNAIGLDSPEILDDTEVLFKMPIEEKIRFWKKVMAYGKDRNIDFYFITWNIFDYGTGGKYGITDSRENEVTRDYFRKSVKQLFITYPDLAGIGLTTGENMKGASADQKEDWAYETYARGILDAAAEMPGRQFKFIHRQHQTGAREIAEKFKDVIEADNVEFLYCFKYAKAHVYSATTQPYHEKDHFVEDIRGMKTLWGLRNDDTYYFRWGAPDFVREFIGNIPHEVARGIYFGSDQWIWGRDFLTKNPETPGQLEVVKHWYQWMLWGRMSYDPTLNNDRLTDVLRERFPGVDSRRLFAAWQQASMIYPVTTGFHWGSLDFQWYIEGCISHPVYSGNETGFHDVNRFITLGVHPKSGNQTIPDFVKMKLADSTSELTSPRDVSQKLHQLAEGAIESLKGLETGGDRELQYTLHDIQTVAWLGKYYAHKIAGSTNVAMYRATKDPKYQEEAVDELTEALDCWERYVDLAGRQNKNPLWTNRVGIVDWKEITTWVEADIDIARDEF